MKLSEITAATDYTSTRHCNLCLRCFELLLPTGPLCTNILRVFLAGTHVTAYHH